ncbi:AAA family ATPase, partial [Myxococcota bacterium]|nr:AAA family ATPase [Myxococcota bacterium]
PVSAALRAAAVAEAALLVPPALRHRLRGAFDLVPRGGHLAVQGRARRGGRNERTLAGRPVSMAGREAECAALQAATPRPGGPGRVVQIIGEAGVGKSRLVAEWLAADVSEGGASPRAVFTAARSGPQHADLDPLPEVFRELAHIVPADTPEDAALKAQLLVRRTLTGTAEAPALPDVEVALLRFLGLARDGRTLDPATSAPPVADDGGRAALFSALATLLAQAAAQRPLIIIVDDADHLGAGARALLAWLFGRLRLHPVGFVLCARAGVSLPPSEASPVEITLAPLAPAPLRQLAEALSAAVSPPPAGLAAWLEARAGGLPGALEALMDDLLEAGVLTEGAGAWHWTPGAALPAVAASHEARLRARLARLDPREVRLLSAAALVGGRCFADLLGALADEPEAEAAVLRLMDLGHLRALREVRCAGGWDFALADAALGAWLSDQRPPEVTRAWHRRAAEWFERAPLAGFEGRDAAIGHHWLAAGEPTLAAPSLLRAARRACRAFAFDAAIGRFEAALAGLDTTSPERAAVSLELAEQHLLAGHLVEAERLAASVHAHGAAALSPRAALCRARALERLGRYAEALETCRAASPDADAQGPVVALMLRTTEAGAALKLGETARAVALLDAHLDPDAAPGGVELETARSVAWRVLGNANVRGRDLDAAARAYTRSHLLAELVRSPVAVVDARIGLGALAYYRGVPREAQAHWAAALDAAERAGLLQQQAILQNNLGEVTLDLDGPAAARPALERAVALQAALGSDEGRADGHRILSECVLALGEVEAAAQNAARALEAAERTGSPYFRGAAHRALARVAHARAPRDPEVAAHLAAAEAHFAAGGLTGELEETRRLAARLGVAG